MEGAADTKEDLIDWFKQWTPDGDNKDKKKRQREERSVSTNKKTKLSKPSKKKSKEQAKNEFEDLVIQNGWRFGPGYKYVNTDTVVPLICDKGHKADKKPDSFKRGIRCAACSGHDSEHARKEFEGLVIQNNWTFGPDYRYIDSNTVVSLICNEGHKADKTPSGFKSGNRCATCSGLDPEQARKEFEDLVIQNHWTFGPEYLYVKGSIVVPLICDKGHRADKRPNDFKKGNRCAICSGNNSHQAKKEFEELVIKNNWTFGTDYKYVNGFTAVPLICDKGHKSNKRPNSFKNGRRCAVCSGLDSEQARKEFEDLVLQNKWTFGPDYQYVNANTTVSLICDKGHRADKTPCSFKSGNRCAVCSGLDSEQAKKEFESLVAQDNWKFGSNYQYTNTHTLVSLICNKGHKADKTPHNFKSGARCAICSGNDSEQARKEFEDLVIQNHWTFGSGYQYTSTNTMVPLICDQGHKADKTPSGFRSGDRCATCSGLDPEQSRKKFEDLVIRNNWTFGADYQYINTRTVVSLTCDKGHRADKTPDNFKSGNRCAICSGNDSEQARKEFEDLVIQNHWTFGPDYRYVKTNAVVPLICSKGHKADKTPSMFKSGDRCAICSGNDSEQAKKEFEQLVIQNHWKFGADYQYVNTHTAVSLICDKGHKVDKTPSSFKRGTRCAVCSLILFGKGTSKTEQLIVEAIRLRFDLGDDFLQPTFSADKGVVAAINSEFGTGFQWSNIKPDIFIKRDPPRFPRNIFVEYDGYPDHGTDSGKNRDVAKSKILLQDENVLFRIRPPKYGSLGLDHPFYQEISNDCSTIEKIVSVVDDIYNIYTTINE